MATSPFELFRRNLKPLMIALTVLAMFAFVVLPALQSYQQMNRQGGTTETTVASYDEGAFDISEIDYFNRNHNLTLRFLSALAQTTLERGGTPQVPGFFQDPRTGEIQALGINTNVSRQSAVTAKLFAQRAESMGMELDDAALRSWLDRFVASKLTPAEINGVLLQSTENQLGQFHLYEQLRTHLLASASQQVLSSGLVGGNQLTTPPAKQFDLFRRLNQQAVATAYPVLVDDFLDQVEGSPSESEIAALYEEGKNRYPDELSPEPAFRQPATRTFEYVTADLQKLIEAEMETIPEARLREEYEQQVEGGAFRMPVSESPAAEPQPVEGEGNETASNEQPAEEAPAMKPEETKPAETKPAETKPAETKPEEAKPEEAKPEAPESEASASEEPAEEPDAAPQEDDAAGQWPSGPRQLVAFRPQDAPETAPELAPAAEPPAEQPAEQEPPAEAEAAATAEEADPAAEPASPAEEQAEPTESEPTEAEPTESPEEEAPAEATDQPAAEVPAAEPPMEPAAEQPAAEQPAAEQPAAEEGPEMRVQSFEEVREDLARQLATAPAREKANAATREVYEAMRKYFTRKAIYEGGADKTAEPPVRPDLQAMAAERGLEYGKTDPLTASELQNHPLGKTAAQGVDMQLGERFPNLAFSGNIPLESPIQTQGVSVRQPYVSWIIDQHEEFLPPLSEARDEVVAYWRQTQARELAQAAAAGYATQANEEDKPLSELVPEDRQSLISENLGPFPWMLWLGPGRRPIEWSVQELDGTGEAFMRQVFYQPIGQFGVAPNQPKTIYYTVQTGQRTPELETLRERFLNAQERQPVRVLASDDVQAIQQGYFEAFREAIGLEWADD